MSQGHSSLSRPESHLTNVNGATLSTTRKRKHKQLESLDSQTELATDQWIKSLKDIGWGLGGSDRKGNEGVRRNIQ
jgi:hypothetical protein